MSQTKDVKLDDSTLQRLVALARIRDRSPHWLMCRAIETFLDREENYEREKREDMARWERSQLTCVAVPHEKAAEWIENLAEGNGSYLWGRGFCSSLYAGQKRYCCYYSCLAR